MKRIFPSINRIHFVGIGGVGMCGIAEVLHNLGYQVTGSDMRRSQTTENLKSLGISIFEGHDPKNIEGADIVVYSSAVKLSNPELTEAIARKIPVIRRAEMLGELMRMKYGIGVAGTHGKTTTTSMIGLVLADAGLDPTIIVGGRVKSLGSGAKLGQGDYLVAEADEFDRSFLRLTPTIAVVTTIEAEHLDCYRDLDEIKSTFVEYMNKVPFYGTVVLCLDERGLRDVIPRIEKRMITYGTSAEADLRAESISFDGFNSSFDAFYRGARLGEVGLKLPGIHNVKNSLAAIAVGVELGIDFDLIGKSLGNFTGVHRRFELKGEINGIKIIDDYAHHPTEIEASLGGARAGGARRIIAIFQPHLYSRTRDFYQEFGRSLLGSDVLIVTDVYPAREEQIPGVTGELIGQAAKKSGHRDVVYIQDKGEIADYVAGIVSAGDLVITFGAGDIWRVGEDLLGLLRGKFEA